MDRPVLVKAKSKELKIIFVAGNDHGSKKGTSHEIWYETQTSSTTMDIRPWRGRWTQARTGLGPSRCKPNRHDIPSAVGRGILIGCWPMTNDRIYKNAYGYYCKHTQVRRGACNPYLMVMELCDKHSSHLPSVNAPHVCSIISRKPDGPSLSCCKDISPCSPKLESHTITIANKMEANHVLQNTMVRRLCLTVSCDVPSCFRPGVHTLFH